MRGKIFWGSGWLQERYSVGICVHSNLGWMCSLYRSRIGALLEDVLVQKCPGSQAPLGVDEMGWWLAKNLELIPFT